MRRIILETVKRDPMKRKRLQFYMDNALVFFFAFGVNTGEAVDEGD